jgi:hypothetical protein
MPSRSVWRHHQRLQRTDGSAGLSAGIRVVVPRVVGVVGRTSAGRRRGSCCLWSVPRVVPRVFGAGGRAGVLLSDAGRRAKLPRSSG